jgi:hypothetical protein
VVRQRNNEWLGFLGQVEEAKLSAGLAIVIVDQA